MSAAGSVRRRSTATSRALLASVVVEGSLSLYTLAMDAGAPEPELYDTDRASREAGDAASILFISEQLPWPKDSGGNLRTYHLLKALGRQYSVTLLTTARSAAAEAAGREALAPVCRRVVVAPQLTMPAHSWKT